MVRDALRDRDRDFQPISSERWLKNYKYQYMFDLDPTHGSKCRVYLSPYNQRIAFMRIEFNPRKAGARGYERIDAMHSLMLQDSSRAHLLSSSSTRIDIATDIPGTRPDDLLIYVNRFSKSRTIYDIQGGALQTLYIGHPDSKRRYCIYDKQAEQRERFNRNIPPMTRVEARLYHRMHPRELPALQNPFEAVRIVDGRNIPDPCNLSTTMNFFLDSCRYRGITEALKVINSRATRRDYRRRLGGLCETNHWNPVALWNDSWADAVNPLLRLFHVDEMPTFRRVRRRRRRVSIMKHSSALWMDTATACLRNLLVCRLQRNCQSLGICHLYNIAFLQLVKVMFQVRAL